MIFIISHVLNVQVIKFKILQENLTRFESNCGLKIKLQIYNYFQLHVVLDFEFDVNIFF